MCVAVCCSVVQCDAVWCIVVQCGVVWCSSGVICVLPCVAVCCGVLQICINSPSYMHAYVCTYTYISFLNVSLTVILRSEYSNMCCSVLQCVAVCCSVLQCELSCEMFHLTEVAMVFSASSLINRIFEAVTCTHELNINESRTLYE